jgi:hypothetical protein
VKASKKRGSTQMSSIFPGKRLPGSRRGIRLDPLVRQQVYKVLTAYNDKKENKIFLIYREIQSGAVEEMLKYFPINEEVVSHTFEVFILKEQLISKRLI